jgi:hypothetical protein
MKRARILELVVDHKPEPLLPLMMQSRSLGELQGTRMGHYHGRRIGRLQGFLFGLVVGVSVAALAMRFGAFLGGH